MKVLIACESSGVVRRAFEAKGHDAWSADLLPAADGSPKHIIGDARNVLANGWDLLIAHPPCTYLSSSGMHWTTRGLRDPKLTEDALALVIEFMLAPVDRIAIENPIGVISTRCRKPDQIVHPWMFGDDASKATCLWLKGLPLLRHDSRQYCHPRITATGKTRWSNQTDSGQNRLGPSADRWSKRSETYPGIAAAMADQWGGEFRLIAAAER